MSVGLIGALPATMLAESAAQWPWLPRIRPSRTPCVIFLSFSCRCSELYDFCSLHLVSQQEVVSKQGGSSK